MSRKYNNLEKELGAIIQDEEITLMVLNTFSKYEENNLKQINKLKRNRIIEHNRIKGALKQTINAHGSINKRLIGSATKRISGALLDNYETKPKFNFNSFFWGVIITTLIALLIV